MRRLRRFKKEEDETWAEYYTRTARIARKIWTKMNLPILSEMIAESMWRVMGWACDSKSKCGYTYLEACIQVEKHEMVADHKSD